MMTLKFFNTLGREKKEFSPIDKSGKNVSMYSCGPTVYNYVHIGNLRAYIFVDLLKRYLKFKGYNVKHVMNLTDVDDKTIRDSQKEEKSLKEFTEFYSRAFMEDIKALNILLPDVMPKATDHIKEMVELIERMKAQGKTYEKNGTTYCKITEVDGYGELACLDCQQLKANADGRLNDADEYEKDDARDFALWKAYEEKDGDVFWETSLGKGRPGWHIECSAMSTKHLGEQFDIHTGGVDLIFPHHTNEIAQTESATGKKWVNYWLHNAHLIVNGEKMSKSLGNFYTLRDLTTKGYDPRSIRFELLKTHYRVQLDFREDELKQIPDTLNKFDEVISKLNSAKSGETNIDCKKFLLEFEEEMDDDLNISGGLAVVFDMIKEINKSIDSDGIKNKEEVIDALKKLDSVLGIMSFDAEEIPEEIVSLADRRLAAKKERDWAAADKLRDEIKSKGYEILDDKEGYRLKKA
ncbi:cysteine--tRNA ligase [Candidatus Woesearchaeota archaeon]|nr:cysteine--tRNA ligase [Candidatus Woesearchaeota archaeon]